MAKRVIFSEVSPLGYRVIAWIANAIADFSFMSGKRGMFVRASNKDPDVHLHYRTKDGGYLCAVVAGGDDQARFLVLTSQGVSKRVECCGQSESILRPTWQHTHGLVR
jgi:hypothetical protein